MRFAISSVFLMPCVFASQLVSLSSTTNNAPHSVILMLQTSAPQPQTPYLELRQLDLDRRQVQPAAAGAPAAAAAGAAQRPAAPAPVAAPAPAAPAAAAPAAPAAAAPAAAGVVGAHGSVAVNQGPATALTTAPTPKAGTIGMGTLTGKVGIIKTAEAKSEAGLAADNRFGFIASWPAAFKVGASVLLGTAVGVGILL